MMIEHGEVFWRGNWDRLYGLLGGNPLAAMPSLHFATSVMAAHLLTELGPVEGAIGWTYASTLGVALVYLGEHYVADLLAGLAAYTDPTTNGEIAALTSSATTTQAEFEALRDKCEALADSHRALIVKHNALLAALQAAGKGV